MTEIMGGRWGPREKKKHLPFIHAIFLCSLVWNGGVVFNVGAGAARHGCRLALDFLVLVWGTGKQKPLLPEPQCSIELLKSWPIREV